MIRDMSLGEDDKPSRPVPQTRKPERIQDDASSYKTSNPRAGSQLAVRTLSPGLSSRGPSRSRCEDEGCLFWGIILQKSEPWVMLGLEFFPARNRIKF